MRPNIKYTDILILPILQTTRPKIVQPASKKHKNSKDRRRGKFGLAVNF